MVLSSGTLTLYSCCLHLPFLPLDPLISNAHPLAISIITVLPSWLKLSPTLRQTLTLSTSNSFPLYLKLLPSLPQTRILSTSHSWPPYLKLSSSLPQTLAISTSNCHHLYLKLWPSLPQTLALSTSNSHPLYLKLSPSLLQTLTPSTSNYHLLYLKLLPALFQQSPSLVGSCYRAKYMLWRGGVENCAAIWWEQGVKGWDSKGWGNERPSIVGLEVESCRSRGQEL